MLTWQDIENRRAKFYGAYQRKIYVALTKQVKAFYKALDTILNLDNIDELIKQLITEDEIKNVYVDLYRKVGARFAKHTKSDLKRTKSLEDDIWMEYIGGYVTSEKLAQIKLVTGTTEAQIGKLARKYIQEGMDSGLTTGEIARNIQRGITKDYSKIKATRALTIARTEVGAAATYATDQAARATGLSLTKDWICVPPGIAKTERHTLLGLEAQHPLIDQPFDVGGVPMLYPYDSSLGAGADNIVNCRCGYAHSVIGG